MENRQVLPMVTWISWPEADPAEGGTLASGLRWNPLEVIHAARAARPAG